MSTSSTEKRGAVVQMKIRNCEAGLLSAISIKADLSLHIVFKICNFRVEISQELQSFVFVLFVPLNDFIILDAVRTSDLTVHRFIRFLQDDRRSLDDMFGVRGSCREAEKLYKS